MDYRPPRTLAPPLTALDYDGDMPAVAEMNPTERRLWFQYLCFHFAYEELKSWKETAKIMFKQYPELVQALYPRRNKITADIASKAARTHQAALQRHAIGDRRLLATVEFEKDLNAVNDLIRISRQAAEKDPDYVNEAIAAMKRKAQMLGYDAPERIRISSGPQGGKITDSQREEAIAVQRWAQDYEDELLAGAEDADYITIDNETGAEVEEPAGDQDDE